MGFVLEKAQLSWGSMDFPCNMACFVVLSGIPVKMVLRGTCKFVLHASTTASTTTGILTVVVQL